MTPGVASGWIRSTEFEGLTTEDYKVAPITIESFIMMNPEPIELVQLPGDKRAAALLNRVVPHPTGGWWDDEDSEWSWTELRANVGWIAPGRRDIEFRIVRELGGAGTLQKDGMPSEVP